MYKIELTSISKNSITIYFSGNLTVQSYLKSALTGEIEVIVMDGNHNNGGWTVLESYEEVIAKIDQAISQK
jgi:hypothetical protein